MPAPFSLGVACCFGLGSSSGVAARIAGRDDGGAMPDHSTPNLPSRDFAATSAFYSLLGFVEDWRDEGWMILKRDGAILEFFPHPELDPLTSWFSCCLRLDDLDAFYSVAKAAGLPEICHGQPRLHAPKVEDSGMRIAYLVDPDGTLVRLVENLA